MKKFFIKYSGLQKYLKHILTTIFLGLWTSLSYTFEDSKKDICHLCRVVFILLWIINIIHWKLTLHWIPLINCYLQQELCAINDFFQCIILHWAFQGQFCTVLRFIQCSIDTELVFLCGNTQGVTLKERCSFLLMSFISE